MRHRHGLVVRVPDFDNLAEIQALAKTSAVSSQAQGLLDDPTLLGEMSFVRVTQFSKIELVATELDRAPKGQSKSLRSTGNFSLFPRWKCRFKDPGITSGGSPRDVDHLATK